MHGSGLRRGATRSRPDCPGGRDPAFEAPPLTHPMVAAQAVASFLTDNGVALPTAPGPDAPRSAGALAAAFGGAVVPLACAR